MRNLIIVLALTVLAAPAAFAAKKFGDAGCGLGSQVFGTEKGFSQVFAATTNGTFGSQTFGITSGTSNCTDDGAVRASAELNMYVEVNQKQLEMEMARGSGESLSGISMILGCQDQAKLNQVLKSQYSSIVTETQDMASSIKSAIKSDAALAQGCKKIG